MARRRTSRLKDVFDIAARSPWWLGVTLAAASYLLLAILSSAAPSTISLEQPHTAFLTILGTFARVFQYILPPIFLLGALFSFVGRLKRRNLLRDTVNGNSSDSIRSMSWREFEQLMGEAFRQQGYAVEETGGNGADGDVGLQLRKQNS